MSSKLSITRTKALSSVILIGVILGLSACRSADPQTDEVAQTPKAFIIVAGQRFETEAPVVTWEDAGSYDGHAEHCWFRDRILPVKPARGCNEPKRYGPRKLKGLDAQVAATVKSEGGYTLETLRERVDQFVLHYDVCGCSKRCFDILHDYRGLSVHFMLDVDGTVYQTLDLAHRGRHATISNDRSVGIEIAQIGAYPNMKVLDRWYPEDPEGRRYLKLPESLGDPALRNPDFDPYPARAALLKGTINSNALMQYDFTAAQYQSLIQLSRTLTEVLPKIEAKVPRNDQGDVIPGKMDREAWQSFRGILGHYHIQRNKSDPGPAFDWDKLEAGLRGQR